MRLFLKLAVSVVFIIVLIWYIGGFGEILKLIVNADHFITLSAFLLITLDRVLMSFKWNILLRSKGVYIPLFDNIKVYCTSMLCGMFLPSTMGADAIRAYLTIGMGKESNVIVASIVVERMFGFIASLIIGMIGLTILYKMDYIDSRFNSLWIIGAVIMLASAVLFACSFSRSLFDAIFHRLPSKITRSKLGRRIKDLHETYISFHSDKKIILVFFLLTFIEQLFSIVFSWLLLLAVGVNVDIYFMVGVLPLTLLVSRIPITIDGLGVFEGVFALLMSLGGVSAAAAVTSSLLGRVVQTLSWAPWGLMYMIGPRSKIKRI